MCGFFVSSLNFLSSLERSLKKDNNINAKQDMNVLLGEITVNRKELLSAIYLQNSTFMFIFLGYHS